MRRAPKIVVWLQLAIILYITMSYQCADQIESQPAAGFDIQVYYGPNDYRSLYVHKEQPEFVLVYQGKRNTGLLTEAEHTKLLNALSEENKKILVDNSVLASDSIKYPYLSVKERHNTNSSYNADFFVILPLNSEGMVFSEITEIVTYIFTKYEE